MGFPFLKKLSTDPAAGTVSIIYTADEDMVIHSMTLTLVTDATAANRRIRLRVDDGSSDRYFRIVAGLVQVASLIHTYTFFPGAPVDAAARDNEVSLPLPANGLKLAKGHRLILDVVGGQAGDDMTMMVMQAERI